MGKYNVQINKIPNGLRRITIPITYQLTDKLYKEMKKRGINIRRY